MGGVVLQVQGCRSGCYGDSVCAFAKFHRTTTGVDVRKQCLYAHRLFELAVHGAIDYTVTLTAPLFPKTTRQIRPIHGTHPNQVPRRVNPQNQRSRRHGQQSPLRRRKSPLKHRHYWTSSHSSRKKSPTVNPNMYPPSSPPQKGNSTLNQKKSSSPHDPHVNYHAT